MSKKIKKETLPLDPCALFLRRLLPHVTGWLVLLVSLSFFTATYDSAHVKLTLLQIGATLLLALWTALQITERRHPFTKKTLLFLAPLFAYLAWQTLSFVCFAYKLEAAEEFIRLLLYGAISTLIACEFSLADLRLVTKYIVVTAWISFIYGLIQIANIWLPGIDLLPWHGFFANRVFSTHANPNFFGAFIVFSSALIGMEFLRTKQKRLLVLLTIGLADLIFTESKGAWLAYAGAGTYFAFGYTNFLSTLKKHLVKINLIALLFILLAGTAAGIYSAKRFQSVSFRAHTWLATFEMAKDSPVLGTGPGSFKLVYPAYRRPQIFYIENAHNNETQHAENEYLEQAATGGIVGLALFLWLFVFLFICTFKNLSLFKKSTAKEKDSQTHALYLLGYSCALAGLLMHAFVDISVHFASSGLLLAVFIGAILALVHPVVAQSVTMQSPKYPRLLLAFRLLLSMATLATLIYMGIEFGKILHHLAITSWGEGLLFILAAGTFAWCLLGAGFLYLRITWKTSRPLVCLVLLLALPVYLLAFRLLAANHYYSLGVALIGLQQPRAALPAFTDAIVRNPYLSEYRQYRANIFALTMDLSKRFVPALGDTDTPRTDYERALEDFTFVQKHNPNHSQLHQDMAQFYYALALRNFGQAQTQPTQAFLYRQAGNENLAFAQKALLDALKLDPVNPNTYILLVNIALLRQDIQEAQNWINAYRQGPAGVQEEEFLLQHRTNAQINALQTHIDRLQAAVK